tara:strand:+ start:17542 stop:19002 length:1461 start_codon:yes stop_codon:yes gene_type:complete
MHTNGSGMFHSNFIQLSTSNWKVEALQERNHNQTIVKCDGAFISDREIRLEGDSSKMVLNNLPCRISFYKKNKSNVEADNCYVSVVKFITRQSFRESDAHHLLEPDEYYVLIDLRVDCHYFNDLLINKCIQKGFKSQLGIKLKAITVLSSGDGPPDEADVSNVAKKYEKRIQSSVWDDKVNVVNKNEIVAFNLRFGANKLTDCIDLEKMQKELIHDYMIPWEDHRKRPDKNIYKTQFYYLLKQVTKLMVTKNPENSPRHEHFLACNLLEEIQDLLNPSPDKLRSPTEIAMNRYSHEFNSMIDCLNNEIVWVHGLGYKIIGITSVLDIDYQFNIYQLIELSSQYLHLSNMDVTDLDLLLLDALIFYLAFSASEEGGYMIIPDLQSKKRLRCFVSFHKEKKILQRLYDALPTYISLPHNKRHIKDLKDVLVNISKSYNIPNPVFSIIDKLIHTNHIIVWPNEEYEAFHLCQKFSFTIEKIQAKRNNNG